MAVRTRGYAWLLAQPPSVPPYVDQAVLPLVATDGLRGEATMTGKLRLFIDSTGGLTPGEQDPDCSDVDVEWPLATTWTGEFLTAADYNQWICGINELHAG